MDFPVVNLSTYPQLILNLSKEYEVTIGDLHGNAIKAIYFLVQTGVMVLEQGQKDYQRLYAIYKAQERENVTLPNYQLTIKGKKGQKLSTKQYHEFLSILKRAHLKPISCVNFIGDEFGDRGNSDTLTALVFEVLKDNAVPYRINVSNHGLVAIKSLKLMAKLKESHRHQIKLLPGQEISLISTLSDLGISSDYENHHYPKMAQIEKAKKPLLSPDEFCQILDESYYPFLNLINYQFDEKDQLNFITHAPAALKTAYELINLLNEKLGTSLIYEDTSNTKIAKMLDSINDVIIDLILKDELDNIYDDIPVIDIPDNPFTRIAWARDYHPEESFITSTGKIIINTHGHVGEDFAKKIKTINGTRYQVNQNLDSYLGRNDNFNQLTGAGLSENGEYRIHCFKVSRFSQQCRLFNQLKMRFKITFPEINLQTYIDAFYEEETDRNALLEYMQIDFCHHLQLKLNRQFQHLTHWPQFEKKIQSALSDCDTFDKRLDVIYAIGEKTFQTLIFSANTIETLTSSLKGELSECLELALKEYQFIPFSRNNAELVQTLNYQLLTKSADYNLKTSNEIKDKNPLQKAIVKLIEAFEQIVDERHCQIYLSNEFIQSLSPYQRREKVLKTLSILNKCIENPSDETALKSLIEENHNWKIEQEINPLAKMPKTNISRFFIMGAMGAAITSLLLVRKKSASSLAISTFFAGIAFFNSAAYQKKQESADNKTQKETPVSDALEATKQSISS